MSSRFLTAAHRGASCALLLLFSTACQRPMPQDGATAAVAATPPRPATPRADGVIPIEAPRTPLPPEAASAGVSRFSFIVYGDTRGRRDGQSPQEEHGAVVDAMLDAIARLDTGPDPVRFILQSGDAVVDGRDARQWNVSFVGLINRLTQQGGVSYFLAPGNHDVTDAEFLSDRGRREGLANYLSAVSALIPANGSVRRLAGYPTYAFGYGNSFVIAFDSNIADDPKQFDWVRSQLASIDRTRYRHVVAMFHHPPLSSGPHGGATIEPPTESVRKRYLPLFRQYGVSLLATGHEHFFEHWVEHYTDRTGQRRRMDQIVSGGGGAPPYWFDGEPDLRAYRRMSSTSSLELAQLHRPGLTPADNPYHFCIVHVDGPTLTIEVVPVSGDGSWRPYGTGRLVLRDSTPPR